MQEQLYGRLTTLQKLRSVRDNLTKHPLHRKQADQAIQTILKQLKDRRLMHLRYRLIQATRAGDLHETWKIENQMRDYEHNRQAIEHDE